jgi:uncharacterized protein (DUF2267 family)
MTPFSDGVARSRLLTISAQEEVDAMKRAELISNIQAAGCFQSKERANMIVRLMIDALRSEMTPGQARVFAEYLPKEFRNEWYAASSYPEGFFDKKEILFEESLHK